MRYLVNFTQQPTGVISADSFDEAIEKADDLGEWESLFEFGVDSTNCPVLKPRDREFRVYVSNGLKATSVKIKADNRIHAADKVENLGKGNWKVEGVDAL